VFSAADPGGAALSLTGRFRRIGAADFTDMTGATAAPLDDGVAYEAVLAWEGPASIGPFSDPVPFAATADPVAPPPVNEASASVSGRSVALAWRGPVAGNFKTVRLYRAPAGTSFAQATRFLSLAGAPGVSGGHTDADRPAGAWTYWITAANGSGVESAPAGPLNATVT
jgi:hypothetical protein